MQKMTQKIIGLVVLLAIICGCGKNIEKNDYEVISPNGVNKIEFKLIENEPKYAVYHGETEVLSLSEMGFLLKDNEDLSKDFEVIKVENSDFDDTWELGRKKENTKSL